MLQEGLNNFLENSVPVSALVGARIYAGQLPELKTVTDLPAIVYKEIHGDGEFSMDGPDQLQYSRMQFSCYGKVYSDAKRVARVLRLELEAFTGALSDGTQVQHMIRESELDIFEDVPLVYCTAVDFRIIYEDSGT
jgi:hypothetical protein